MAYPAIGAACRQAMRPARPVAETARTERADMPGIADGLSSLALAGNAAKPSLQQNVSAYNDISGNIQSGGQQAQSPALAGSQRRAGRDTEFHALPRKARYRRAGCFGESGAVEVRASHGLLTCNG